MSGPRSKPTGTALSMVGLALKAGQLAIGTEAVTAALGRHRAHLVILAQDLSDGSRRRIEREAEGVPTVHLAATMETMGLALGRNPTGVAAVLDHHLAKAISRRQEMLDGGEGGPNGRLVG
ncbi:MAG: L7Ae/L30e/S12e/Gadd45 family ribosomal protein [Sulfobacillus sp.]